MHKELKKAVINWLLDNEKEFQRVTACHQYFRPYIYDTGGDYLIGGDKVSDFIHKADALLYND